MFRKILIFAMFATAAGYCFAASDMPQIVTSEVFYTQDKTFDGGEYEQQIDTLVYQTEDSYEVPAVAEPIPVWPIAGSDADVEIACGDAGCAKTKQADNIRIVSKIGADLVVENNFGVGPRGGFGGWSGGANLLHGTQIPVGFDNECYSGSEMPLLHREVLEDDGGDVLAVSRNGRKKCNSSGYADGYAAFAVKNGMKISAEDAAACDGDCSALIAVNDENGMPNGKLSKKTKKGVYMETEEEEISVDLSADAEPAASTPDQVRSWVVASGQTLRSVLQNWCDKEGWDLVWATAREYPIEASAVFKGRFVDVASAVVRNFGRANPVPYAKFYKGNRVLVISTSEE